MAFHLDQSIALSNEFHSFFFLGGGKVNDGILDVQ